MTDLVHELNRKDAAASSARIAAVRVGLSGPDLNRQFYRNMAEWRIEALEQDADFFGLVPHEEDELRQLKALLAGSAV